MKTCFWIYPAIQRASRNTKWQNCDPKTLLSCTTTFANAVIYATDNFLCNFFFLTLKLDFLCFVFFHQDFLYINVINVMSLCKHVPNNAINHGTNRKKDYKKLIILACEALRSITSTIIFQLFQFLLISMTPKQAGI